MAMSPRLLRPIASGVHPEAAAWRSAVVANGGGTPSPATMRAVSRLCSDIDKAGIRDRFFRMGIFAGPSLNAALVPLYRGPTYGGTTYGNATDTNNGLFVSGDYAETGASGGLKGNGSSKYLDTGLSTQGMGIGAATGHLGLYHSAPTGASTTRIFMGANNSGNGQRYYLASNAASPAASSQGFYGWLAQATETLGSQVHAPAGHRLINRTSVNQADLVQYYNGSSVATGNAVGSPAAEITESFFIHAVNNAGSAGNYNDGRVLSYSIGYGLTAQQVADFYNAMQTFQTALSRNL